MQANKEIKIWNGKQYYFAVLIALLLKVEKLSRNVTAKTFFKIFLVSILIKKVREEKGRGGGGGYSSVALYSSFRARKNYQATRKLSARIIFQTIEKCACMHMMKPVT